MTVRLLMLSAMYENGGNVTHRHLDGHPELLVYPFESQLGTRYVQDDLTSMFPVKYRWPVFALGATAAEDHRAIIDEELRVRARTPHVSKFRHVPFDLDDEERAARFVEIVGDGPRTTGGNVAAFFRSTFDVWRDVRRSGRESVFVGYSPIVAVDGDRMLRSMPDLHLLHVVRNPWSAYADTKKRPVPLSLATYVRAWAINQHAALVLRALFPGRVHIVRLEDLLASPHDALGPVLRAVAVDADAPSLGAPTWNGEPLDEVYPWGTIRRASVEANLATAHELSPEERAEVRARAEPFAEALGYSVDL